MTGTGKAGRSKETRGISRVIDRRAETFWGTMLIQGKRLEAEEAERILADMSPEVQGLETLVAAERAGI